jgi:putative transposase
MLSEQHNYPVEKACALIELPHSTYYYRHQQMKDSQLTADLQLVAGQHPTYGSRRITQQLRRVPFQYQINRKRTQRLMREMELLRPCQRRKYRTTDSGHSYRRYSNLVKNLVIIRPEQVWVSDITYIRLGKGFVFLAIIMDVFTRAIRGWHLSVSLDTELSLRPLRQALKNYCPEIHHSDQGVHYASKAYIDTLNEHHIQISMAAQGKPEENGYAERLMRTIKEEEVDLSEYQNYDDAYHQIGRFINDVYMTKRIHSSLGYLTPAEFEAAYWLVQPAEASP